MFIWKSNKATFKRRAVLLEELEMLKVINEFATSLVEQDSVEDILWDVTRNCISRMNFVDCVVYMLDEPRNTLIQVAAHGPKNPRQHEIHQPIEIPVGKGIVGCVALRGVGEIVRDTSKDQRYIQDDQQRLSEITVPIMANGKVIGVIDAEHPEKSFFKPRHLKVLSTIASLCAHKITRLRIEQAYRQSEYQLEQKNRKIAEAKLLALRSQMSPHFIFNSLNSINNFILQNDKEHASRFLTRFSKLMRQILDNAKTEWVSLKNELNALRIYTELEQLRFDGKFEVEIHVDESLEQEWILVPSLILHTYVENAIWHGLLHKKEGVGKLWLECWQRDGWLYLQVKDNGVGRAASAEINKKGLTAHKFHGIKISEERLLMVNEIYQAEASVDIKDLKDIKGIPTGTQVTVQMKVRKL